MLSVLLMLSSTAVGQISAAPAATVITSPHWIQTLQAEDIARSYPAAAARSEISGAAELECAVDQDGRMSACRVFAEAPENAGFGAAALQTAVKFRIAPASLPPAPATVFIPIHYNFLDHPRPARSLLVAPRWSSAPSFADLGRAFPVGSGAEAGDVSLRCHMAVDGSLKTCQVRVEQPSGTGFAAAALAIAPRFRVEQGGRAPRATDNFDVDVRIHLVDPASPEFQERRITQPAWLTLPDPSQALALYPAAASAQGVKTGRGVAECNVAVDGRLESCVPRFADPDGLGFSEAAASLASTMRMNRWTAAGGPIDGAKIDLPLRFDAPPSKH